MAKLRCRLGLKYLHKLWQSPPTNKNRLKKKTTEKLWLNLRSPPKSTAIFLTNLKLWLSTEEFNVILSLQHGIKTAFMGTTGCQLTIISAFLFFFLILLQKAQVYNLISALVLSALCRESLLLLFRKSKLNTCNGNVQTQPTLRFNFNVFSHALSGWKSVVCFIVVFV